jgi:divinyl chlorophyllide a 8-vinyl-reductase
MIMTDSDVNAHAQLSGQKRIFMLGATGTIGRATLQALLDRGHEVTCFLRRKSDNAAKHKAMLNHPRLTLRYGDVTDTKSISVDGFGDKRFDVVVSCLASRTGAPRDAWAIDYRAHHDALDVAKDRGVKHFILLSALCVQKPRLEFQHAKLKFEKELIKSGLIYSIIRPTAFFKSLSGQVERVKAGKPFLIFGDGRVTACKPISDRDLAAFIVMSLNDENYWNKILPIGGPGPAITPRDQGDYLFERLQRAPKFKSVPLWFMKAIITFLALGGRISSRFADQAELARIGYYYATESMLVLNPETGLYDETLTPSTGQDTLFGHYDQLIHGEIHHERGDHSVF